MAPPENSLYIYDELFVAQNEKRKARRGEESSKMAGFKKRTTLEDDREPSFF